MALSSIELARRCRAHGLLSKEAADDVLRIRQRLYREAMAKVAAGVFSGLRRGAGSAAGKASSFFDDMKRHLGFPGMAGPKHRVHSARTAKEWSDVGKLVKDEPKQPLSWAGYASNLAQLVALGAGLQGAGMAVTGLMRHSRDQGVKTDIANSYKEMFNETPMLSELDPQKVTRHFDVLARYAPSLAADPTVAGAWVKGTVQMGHVDANAIERLGATQAMIDRHHESRALFQPSQFQSAVGLATKAMGGGGGGGGGGGD